jgi:RNA polymerase sigma factor (sigma-70 family)
MALEQDQRISEVVKREQSRLRNFIRRRVPDPRDAEDILQDVFYELVEANRLLMPIEHVTGWLFRVARHRIADLFRKKWPEAFSYSATLEEDDTPLPLEELLPSPDAGPEALYARSRLLDELELAIDELPAEQREVASPLMSGRNFGKRCARVGASAHPPARARGNELDDELITAGSSFELTPRTGAEGPNAPSMDWRRCGKRAATAVPPEQTDICRDGSFGAY